MRIVYVVSIFVLLIVFYFINNNQSISNNKNIEIKMDTFVSSNEKIKSTFEKVENKSLFNLGIKNVDDLGNINEFIYKYGNSVNKLIKSCEGTGCDIYIKDWIERYSFQSDLLQNGGPSALGSISFIDKGLDVIVKNKEKFSRLIKDEIIKQLVKKTDTNKMIENNIIWSYGFVFDNLENYNLISNNFMTKILYDKEETINLLNYYFSNILSGNNVKIKDDKFCENDFFIYNTFGKRYICATIPINSNDIILKKFTELVKKKETLIKKLYE